MHSHRPTRCRVCGCHSLEIDEVHHRGRWLLAECERCRYRWTRALPDVPPPPARMRRVAARAPERTEVARAA